jgi:hypothetical protein
MALTDNVPSEDLRRIMREHGPQWSRMYYVPETPEQDKANEVEYRDGMKRVREYIRQNYS